MAAPLLPEPQVGALCEVLNAYGVRYVVFGSVAGRLYGADLRTVDLDIVPDISDDNLQRLADALNSLNTRWRVSEEGPGMKVDGRLEPRHFRGDSRAVGLVTEIGYLDVVLHPRGFEEGYSVLLPRAVTVDVGGVQVVTGAIDDVIVSKELLGREKDLEHLLELRRLVLERRAGLGLETCEEGDIDRNDPEP